jgi:hypothetical protein
MYIQYLLGADKGRLRLVDLLRSFVDAPAMSAKHPTSGQDVTENTETSQPTWIEGE